MAIDLPELVPFPVAAVRHTIPSELWNVCLDSWKTLLHARVLLSDTAHKERIAEDGSLIQFLVAFVAELSFPEKRIDEGRHMDAHTLDGNVLLLTHRALMTGHRTPPELLNWTYIANLCAALHGHAFLNQIVSSLWSKHSGAYEASLQIFRMTLVDHLDNTRAVPADWTALKSLAYLLQVEPAVGRYIMTGSDLIDSLAASYASLEATARAIVTVVMYLGLSSLLTGSKSQPALAFDMIYGLVSAAESKGSQRLKFELFLQDVVSQTPLLSIIKPLSEASEGVRAKSVLEKLLKFYQSQRVRPTTARKRAIRVKDKAAAAQPGTPDAHVPSMSLVTQIQELFPDLGSAFILRLLDQYDENVELVTTHLLEDDIPFHLRQVDRTENLRAPAEDNSSILERAPSSRNRRTVFDDDEFDRLAVDTSRIHIGRRFQSKTADDLLSSGMKRPSQKAAVLSALAAFDADDDERDDTYDIADVGGTVDSVKPDGMEETKDTADEAHQGVEGMLFRTWQSRPEVFARDASTRRSPGRQALKKETSMTDEAIEGWALMVQRDSRRARALETRYSMFHGSQQTLASTSWRAGEQDAEDSEASGTERGGGRRGRGAGRSRGRGRGTAAGETSDKSTQLARDLKESHKGSRANHNRRAQRAKKIARAGFGV